MTVRCTGEPVRVSVCHCLACQQRTGSAFSAQARFPENAVTVDGSTAQYERIADSGAWIRYRFCPRCGSNALYRTQEEPGLIAVPLGNFANPHAFSAPATSVYEERAFDWVTVAAGSHHR
ncbi:GFA family protein [Stakelama saccharophila]|uniref:GFA family protein n=1 Tax=Stakelama saccharophila TaxID=3075605 RepID=A0ABZ0B5B5_9SPHN|nr:GFA family protein [Stakelama sp. W311]WNO52580.1 GFA family protein [Stakelama sp. W311]